MSQAFSQSGQVSGLFWRNLPSSISILCSSVLLWFTLPTAVSSVIATAQPAPNPLPVLPQPGSIVPQLPTNQGQPLAPPATPFPPLTPLPASSSASPTEPEVTDPKVLFKQYRLGPGDSVSVVVPRFPDLSLISVVNPEGNIISPLLGPVSVEGLTIAQAQERIRERLNRYVIDPVVILSLTGARPVQVTVTGEIARPGIYPLTFPRVSAALLTAGGTVGSADLREIQVRRSLIDGSVIEQKIDLFTPLQSGAALPDMRLEDGDAVIVPKLEVGSDRDYNRALVARSTLVKPQITVRILSYPNDGLGSVLLPSGSNFVDALTAATPNLAAANLRKIVLVRFDPERGKAITRQLDGKKALLGDAAQNIPLQDNDVIVINRNLIAKITNTLNVFTQPFRDVLGFLLFFRELSDSAETLFGPAGGSDQNSR